MKKELETAKQVNADITQVCLQGIEEMQGRDNFLDELIDNIYARAMSDSEYFRTFVHSWFDNLDTVVIGYGEKADPADRINFYAMMKMESDNLLSDLERKL